MKELEKAELCAAGSGYQVYDRLGSVNHLMKEFIEEDTKGIPKFCITCVVNSNMLPYKKQWLDKYYPGEIKTIWDKHTRRENQYDKTARWYLFNQDRRHFVY